MAARTFGLAVRTAVGSLWYVGAWWLAARVLGRLKRRELLDRLGRAWAAGVVRFLRIDLRVTGLEHISGEGEYVVVSLHEGFADVLALLHLPLVLRFVARDELAEWKMLGGLIRDTGQIVVEPERPRSALRHLLRAGREVLDAGESVVVFPQGTILGVETAFRAGAELLAARAGRRILPVVITGTHRVWEHPFSPLVRYGQRVRVTVLPPRADAAGLAEEMKSIALADEWAPVRHFDPNRDGFWDDYSYEIDPGFPELAEQVAAHRVALNPRGSR